jgi:CheY-like chemotaxis protein
MELEKAPFELALCVEEALDLFAPRRPRSASRSATTSSRTSRRGSSATSRACGRSSSTSSTTPSSSRRKGSISIQVRRIPLDASVRATEAGRMRLEITVQDTGIGIPPDKDRPAVQGLQPGGLLDDPQVRRHGPRPGDLPAPLPADEWRHPRREQRRLAAPDTHTALQLTAALPEPPVLLVVGGGKSPDASPLEALANLRCPRLVMIPFGQPPPAQPKDGFPFGSVAKPLKNTSFMQAVVALFAPVAAEGPVTPTAQYREPILGHEFPLNVLLAEDNHVNQKVALRFLERMGYRADAVGNGLEVIAALENQHYDLVLMDLQMPEMDGLEATRQIRKRLAHDRQPKIIALTANAMQGDRDICMAAGMDDYISKPVKINEITAVIRRQFGNKSKASSAVGA